MMETVIIVLALGTALCLTAGAIGLAGLAFHVKGVMPGFEEGAPTLRSTPRPPTR